MAGIGVESRYRSLFSYQSLMPAGTGTPRCEKPESWVGSANLHGGFCRAPPDPCGGQAPALHFHRKYPLDSGQFRRNDVLEGGIGDPGSGGMWALSGPRKVIFVPIAHAGRDTGAPRYEKPECAVLNGEFARGILPCPGPTPAGDKPPHYISHPRPSIPASAGIRIRRIGQCVSGDMRALSGSRAHSRTNDREKVPPI